MLLQFGQGGHRSSLDKNHMLWRCMAASALASPASWNQGSQGGSWGQLGAATDRRSAWLGWDWLGWFGLAWHGLAGVAPACAAW